MSYIPSKSVLIPGLSEITKDVPEIFLSPKVIPGITFAILGIGWDKKRYPRNIFLEISPRICLKQLIIA